MAEGVNPAALGGKLPDDGEEAEGPKTKKDVVERHYPTTRGSQALAWRRRDEIAALLGDNYRIAAIAREMELSEAGVRYHIDQMLVFWRERALATFDERQARQLAQAERIMDMLMECFEASKGGRKVEYNEEIREMLHNQAKRGRRKTQGTKHKGEPIPKNGAGKYKRYTREEQSHGDPRFMALYIEMFKEMNRLLAVYPSDRPEVEEGKVDRRLAQMPRATLVGKVKSLLQSAQLERQRREAQAADEAEPAEGVVEVSREPAPQPEEENHGEEETGA